MGVVRWVTTQLGTNLACMLNATALLRVINVAVSIAPEVLGPEKYDLSCDVWSIGVITYIL